MLQRCVGFMMAKMVLRELMDPSIFMRFKAFLTKVNNTGYCCLQFQKKLAFLSVTVNCIKGVFVCVIIHRN